jgi:hypothetical protein
MCGTVVPIGPYPLDSYLHRIEMVDSPKEDRDGRLPHGRLFLSALRPWTRGNVVGRKLYLSRSSVFT